MRLAELNHLRFQLAFAREPGTNRAFLAAETLQVVPIIGIAGALSMMRTHLIAALCAAATLLLHGTSDAATLYQYNFDNSTSGTWTTNCNME